MVKSLILLLFCLNSLYAQEFSRDLDFIETQNTLVNPFNIPVYMGLDGEINLLSRDAGSAVNFNGMGQISFKINTSLYIKPIQKNSFSFMEQARGQEWIEVKRNRWEVGAGLASFFANNMISVGLVPFKGARQVMIRTKLTQNEKTDRPKLPKELEEMRNWRVNDQGTFQRFGGVQIFAGLSYSVVTILSATVTIQNLWNVSLQKLKGNKVLFSIAEENLNKRKLQSGVAVANARVHFFNGKRLTSFFTLDLDNPEHHELYRLALAGKLSDIQKVLPEKSQKTDWKGSERIGYYGLPAVAGKHVQRSEYDVEFNGEEDVIDVRSKRNAGFLRPMRNHNKLVYQTDNAIILYWYSDMNKAKGKDLAEHFLNPGKVMGVKGFDNTIPEGTEIGSSSSQMVMNFTREEIESVDKKQLDEILVHFKERCVSLDLDCARENRFRKIEKTLNGFLGQKWEKYRDNLGFTLLDEPALIYSYLKSIKSKKQVYFKFLNQKYQSLEGAAQIEI